MATVAIDTHHLEVLPHLCTKTGEPTEMTHRQDYLDIPGWTLLLIFWGVIPFLIAAGFARRKITVDLPASEETLRRIRLVDRGAVAGLVLGIGLVIAGLASQGGAGFAWAGIGVATVTLVGAAVMRLTVWVIGRLDGEVLWLYGVDAAFAEQAEAVAPGAGTEHQSANRWTAGLLAVAIIGLGMLLFLAIWLGT